MDLGKSGCGLWIHTMAAFSDTLLFGNGGDWLVI